MNTTGYFQRMVPTENGGCMFIEHAPSGVVTVTLPDGTRLVETISGRVYRFHADGSYEVQKPNGLKMAVDVHGNKSFTHAMPIQLDLFDPYQR